MSAEHEKAAEADLEKSGMEHKSDGSDSHKEMTDIELAYYYEDKAGSLVVDPESVYFSIPRHFRNLFHYQGSSHRVWGEGCLSPEALSRWHEGLVASTI